MGAVHGVSVYQLIPPPAQFDIDLGEIGREEIIHRTLMERIKNVALPAILEYGKMLGSSMGEAVWKNIKFMPDTLGIFVGRHVRDGNELYFRLGAWAVLHLIGFIVVTVYVFREKLLAMPSQLLNYADPLINTKHLKTKNQNIDVSGVPGEITVDSLVDIFNEINFTDPNRPGYMPELSRREGETIYTVPQLRNALEQNFVRRVNSREAFLGTPPAWNIAQLHEFYKQIEDAVRFTVHKLNTDLENFKQSHENWHQLHKAEKDYVAFMEVNADKDKNGAFKPLADAHPLYDQYTELLKGHKDYQTYVDLIQARSRFAIDLAIAGFHCGARFMGDTMDNYFFHKGEIAAETLADDIENTLADMRKEIAIAHIGAYMTPNTHNFAAYMANLGGLLGIPGTKGVIEHLGGLRNRNELLTHFFAPYDPEQPDAKSYNPITIRERIQAKFKSSQPFRERVYQWLKDNAHDWNKQEFDAKKQVILTEIQASQGPEQESPALKYADVLTQWISELVNEKVITNVNGTLKAGDQNLPDVSTQWNDFLAEVIALPEAKEKLDKLLGIPSRDEMTKQLQAKQPGETVSAVQVTREIMKLRNDWKSVMVAPVFENVLKNMAATTIRGEKVANKELQELVLTNNWISSVNLSLSKHDLAAMPVETLLRCHGNQARFEDALENHLSQQRNDEFLSKLNPGDADKPLRPEVLEWVLVAHGALNPPKLAEQRVVE